MKVQTHDEVGAMKDDAAEAEAESVTLMRVDTGEILILWMIAIMIVTSTEYLRMIQYLM